MTKLQIWRYHYRYPSALASILEGDFFVNNRDPLAEIEGLEHSSFRPEASQLQPLVPTTPIAK
jgi:hypothetical protein